MHHCLEENMFEVFNNPFNAPLFRRIHAMKLKLKGLEALLQVKAYQYWEQIVRFFIKVQTLESFLVFGIFWINNVKKCCFPAGWWEGEDPCNETIKKIKFWNKLLILDKLD